MFCSKCGAPVQEGAAFCGRCGMPIVPQQPVMQQPVMQQPVQVEEPVQAPAESVQVEELVGEPAPVEPVHVEESVQVEEPVAEPTPVEPVQIIEPTPVESVQPVTQVPVPAQTGLALNNPIVSQVVDAPVSQNVIVKPTKKKKKFWIIPLIIILLAALGGAGFYVWNFVINNNENEKQVVEYLEEVNVHDIANKVSKVDNQDSAKYCENAMSVLKSSYNDVESVKSKIKAVEIDDKKFTDNVDTYLFIVEDWTKGYYDFLAFYSELIDFANNYLDKRPVYGNYKKNQDYYNAVKDWQKKTSEAYSKIKCPDSISAEWKKFADILDINNNMLSKFALAVNNQDVMKNLTFKYTSDRYEILVKNWSQTILTRSMNELKFYNDKVSDIDKVKEELNSYVNLSRSKREAYAFTSVDPHKVILSYEAIETIYPALYNSTDAVLIVKAGCVAGEKDIVIETDVEGFSQTFKSSYHINAGCSSIYVKPPIVTANDFGNAKDAQIHVKITESDGTTFIDEKTFPVKIMSKNDVEWVSDEFGATTQDNILCYLTPSSKKVTELKRKASDILKKLSINDRTNDSLQGYQSPSAYGSKNPALVVYVQAYGLMSAMSEMGVKYQMDAYSLGGANQHVLFPDQVLETKTGLCIETSLVIASACQSLGFNTYLVFPPGHAQVVIETWDGSGEYFLIETTALSSDFNSYKGYLQYLIDPKKNKEPSNAPIRRLKESDVKNFLYVIDCSDNREYGLTSIF